MAKSRRREDRTRRVATDTTAANPDRERVAQRAYELYMARGGGDGQALDDWLIAERELLTGGGGKMPPKPPDES